VATGATAELFSVLVIVLETGSSLAVRGPQFTSFDAGETALRFRLGQCFRYSPEMDENNVSTDDVALGGSTPYRKRNGVRTYLFNQLGDVPFEVRDEVTAAMQMVGSLPDLSPSLDLIELHEPHLKD
jgi:hypothetical protein